MTARIVAGAALLLSALACESSTDMQGAATPAPATTSSPSPTPWPEHAPDPHIPYEGDWQLVSGTAPAGPIPISRAYPVTLTLDGRQAGGTSTCNNYGGRFWIVGRAFSWVPAKFGAEQRGCPSDRTLRAEDRYFAAFVHVDTVDANERTLEFTGPGVELVFERLPDPDLEAILDVTWVAGAKTLRLSSDGTFRVTNPCDVVVGEWYEQSGRLYVLESRSEGFCPGRLGASTPDRATFVVRGDRLTIVVDGRTTVYRRS